MLETLIREEIQNKGPLSQSRYMELALQHPLYGYYRSQEAIGHDFTTSPEISQVFGEVIAAWALDYYTKRGQPDTITLIELGPGKGTLMADFLRTAKLSKTFSEALSLCFVEINPLLKAIQQQKIPGPATWVEKLEQVPASRAPLFILANEFFDALPTNCMKRKDNILYERCIGDQVGKLVFTDVPFHNDPGTDQIWEESPDACKVMHEICKRLLKQQGVFLCVDYGYDEGSGETLQALFKGKPSEPLSYIGKSDLTCHVNFGKLKEIACSYGLGVLGPLPQGKFLKNIGFDVRTEFLKKKNPLQKKNLDDAAIRLTHPHQMGTLFKVMAVYSPPSPQPIGFNG